MKIRQFLLSHRKVWITFAVLFVFIGTSVYQSIYANEDGLPTTTVYWMIEDPIQIDRDAAWLLPHDGGYLLVTNDGTLACGINAGMSLSFLHIAEETQTKLFACAADDEDFRILCAKQSEQSYVYSLRTVSSDGEILHEIPLPDRYGVYVDCRMTEDTLALVTETQFLVFSISDIPRLLFAQDYTGTAPQVCITEDTVLFSTSSDTESSLYEYNLTTDTANIASLSKAPLFALSAAPDQTDSKYLIGCGTDLLGLDAEFSVIERFFDLREAWQKSQADSTFKKTLTQDNISAVFTDGTILYITDINGTVYKFDVFWGDSM